MRHLWKPDFYFFKWNIWISCCSEELPSFFSEIPQEIIMKKKKWHLIATLYLGYLDKTIYVCTETNLGPH